MPSLTLKPYFHYAPYLLLLPLIFFPTRVGTFYTEAVNILVAVFAIYMVFVLLILFTSLNSLKKIEIAIKKDQRINPNKNLIPIKETKFSYRGFVINLVIVSMFWFAGFPITAVVLLFTFGALSIYSRIVYRIAAARGLVATE